MTVYEAISYIGDFSVSYYYWLRPFVLLLYTIFWIGCCFLKRRAALGYLVLTIVNVAFYFFGPENGLNLDGRGLSGVLTDNVIILKHAVGDLLFVPLPVNILFSFIILLYYQRMQPASKKRLKAEPEK